MALTPYEHEEMQEIGRSLDNGVGSLPDEDWAELEDRYHELQAKMIEQSARPSA